MIQQLASQQSSYTAKSLKPLNPQTYEKASLFSTWTQNFRAHVLEEKEVYFCIHTGSDLVGSESFVISVPLWLASNLFWGREGNFDFHLQWRRGDWELRVLSFHSWLSVSAIEADMWAKWVFYLYIYMIPKDMCLGENITYVKMVAVNQASFTCMRSTYFF